jgi:hypothetical protein
LIVNEVLKSPEDRRVRGGGRDDIMRTLAKASIDDAGVSARTRHGTTIKWSSPTSARRIDDG